VTTVGSLCTGYGGLDDALHLAGLGGELVFVADTDRAAGLVLDRQHPGVPNLGDITVCDWSGVTRVDVLTAGFPCQPHSLAGRRRGADDVRNLWPDVQTAITVLRPPTVVLENVPGLLTVDKGVMWRQIIADLDRLGYTTEWTTVGACAVGAAHCRHRVFAVATSYPQPIPDGAMFGLPLAAVRKWPRAAHIHDGQLWTMPVPACGKRGPLLPTPSARDADRGAGWGDKPGRPLSEVAATLALLPTPTCSDGNGHGVTGSGGLDLRTAIALLPSAVQPARWGRHARAIARHEQVFGTHVPDPTEPGRTGNPRLSPRFVEWLMCLPAGQVTDVPDLTRSDQLRLLGNGVVPTQAVAALRILGVGAHDLAEVA
jgi:DNA (cytosine-5)-methyltransferase 1